MRLFIRRIYGVNMSTDCLLDFFNALKMLDVRVFDECTFPEYLNHCSEER